MTSTEARRIVAQHGDSLPEARGWPMLPDDAANLLRVLNFPFGAGFGAARRGRSWLGPAGLGEAWHGPTDHDPTPCGQAVRDGVTTNTEVTS